MKLNDITLLTVSFNNNNILTGLMLKSLHKQLGQLPNVIIIDNGNTIPVDDALKSCFSVIDNFKHKLLPDEYQTSRNHAKSIDYALKNLITTKWCLLVDNDVLFKPELKLFLQELDDNKYDCVGEIGYDTTPPNRLFPYFCLINVNRFRLDKLNYFDRNRIIAYTMPGHMDFSKENFYDTGYSFYEDIKNSWNILEIKINDYINHCKNASFKSGKDKYKRWLAENKYLYQ